MLTLLVIFLRVKDDLCGEVPVAFIKRIEGSEITENEIKQFVSKEVNYCPSFQASLTHNNSCCCTESSEQLVYHYVINNQLVVLIIMFS
jgi:hypothetical protein